MGRRGQPDAAAIFSFWDFRQTVPKQRPVDDETFCFAMFGSDLLLKHLWKIYTDDITACKKIFIRPLRWY